MVKGARPHRWKRMLAEGRFAPIGWDEALGRIAEAFRLAAARHGPEAVWPYHSGGTMGVLARWGLDRLRHVMGYSRQKSTICVTPAEMGWRAGHGAARGADPRLEPGGAEPHVRPCGGGRAGGRRIRHLFPPGLRRHHV